jgi:hypothetical protein
MYRQKVDSTRCGKKQRSVYALGHCGTFRITLEHWENTQKFGSCPLRSKTLVFPGFFAFLANCFGRL